MISSIAFNFFSCKVTALYIQIPDSKSLSVIMVKETVIHIIAPLVIKANFVS
jgi:hypothetical protein